MAKAKKKTVAKSAAVDKNLTTAMEKLERACADGNSAVATRTKANKKFATTIKRLTKRKATLAKRKKTATTRAAKNPTGDNKKALRTVVKDLGAATKELKKAKATKAPNSAELTALKASMRRANAYQKAIAQIDRDLNKPKKKPAKKAAPKKA